MDPHDVNEEAQRRTVHSEGFNMASRNLKLQDHPNHVKSTLLCDLQVGFACLLVWEDLDE